MAIPHDPPTVPVTVEVIPYDPARGLISAWDEETVLKLDLRKNHPAR